VPVLGVALLGGVVAVAFALYLAWGIRERRRHAGDVAVAEDVAALGVDAAPVSIHPRIDPDRCIGSGACVEACPEERVLGFLQGQASLINPLACIGHGACMAACPVHAIELVFGTATRGVELPQVGPDFQTNQPGVYVAGELGGMGLIRNAVEQGRQAAAQIARGGRRGARDSLDAVVIGAGPAGLSAALQLIEEGLRVEVLEQGELGGSIRHYPRAKVVMTGVLDIPRHGKVRARTMSKEELLGLWGQIQGRGDVPIRTGERVEQISPLPSGEWLIRSSGGETRAANVVLALGRRGAPRRLDVPGEDLAKVCYRLLEPAEFAGKHVLVVGGGNAAADVVVGLAAAGRCASLAVSYRRAAFARLRPSVRAELEGLIAGGRVRALLPTEVMAIAPATVTLARPDGTRFEIENDAVVVQVGGTTPTELLRGVGIHTVEKRGER
jgi:thioredoxin reductase/NAD-dependent dihydropyrimidine dehydrogenase PreA subunit